MQEELVYKIHQQKYFDRMSFEEYHQALHQGFDLIKASGISTADLNGRKAVNLALEYNMELMVNYLSL